MKTQFNRPLNLCLSASMSGLLLALAFAAHAADPRTNGWFTTYSGQYARVYTNDAMKDAGTALTTWSNGTHTQSRPAYCGIQEVYSSSNWVYVRSTGLAGYIMGPWYLNAARTQMFPNLPLNQKLLYRFPRTNGVPAVKSITGGGQIGISANGVELFNSWDAHYWDPGANADVAAGPGADGYWNRDAYVNEGITFDPAYAHQQQDGTYHYHADPIAVRYQLGDHVDYNPLTRTYSESTNPVTRHSPILGWMADGFPLYGPYGFSDPANPASGIRRMVSGYVPRDGTHGADNLSTNGAARSTIPAWAQRLYGVSAAQSGPTVSTSYPFGRYMEDNAYLGDLTNSATGSNYRQGVDFDLDEYNGRWCVTPEFPDGTYAYFVSISSSGTPVYPYNIGRGFYGDPVGGSVPAITEPVVTNFLGNTNLPSKLNSPTVGNGMVTLTWSAVEGGRYQVETTTNPADSTAWTVVASEVSPNEMTGTETTAMASSHAFYRVSRTAVTDFDPVSTGSSLTAAAPGGGADRGTTVTVTITLPGTPPNPPANAPIASVTLAGSINGTGISDATSGTVIATFAIPADAPTGAQDIVVTYKSPGPTYTLTGGLTIN